MTKALIGLGAIGCGAFCASRIAKRLAAKKHAQELENAFDFSDLEEPVVVTEEVVVVTEASPYDVEMDLIPNEPQTQAEPGPSPFDMPGRGAGPR